MARAAILAPLVVIAAAAAALAASPFEPRSETIGQIAVAIVGGLALGAVGHLAARARPWAARITALGALVGAVAWTWARGLSWIAEHAPLYRWSAGASVVLAVVGLRIGASAMAIRTGAAGLAAGAALAFGAASWSIDPVPGVLLLAFVIGRDLALRPGELVRQRLASIGAGVCLAAAITTIGFDIAAVLIAHGLRNPMARMWVDGPSTPLPRLVLAVVVLRAALAHARGRTWGVLVLAVAAPFLAVGERLGLWLLPGWSSGCFSVGHPLSAGDPLEIVVLAGTAIAVAPWMGPIARHLRAGPDAQRSRSLARPSL